MLDTGANDEEMRVGPPALPGEYGKPLAPVSPAERIVTLDVLRGIALLGILIANMMHFSQPLEESGLRSGLWFSAMDRVADWVTLFLVEGKFYPLFSFLFGLGFSIQMNRAAARGLDPMAVYRRRLFVLMGFGLAHGIFVWNGDVLFCYAFCGFGLLLFRNRKALTIKIWAAALILLPALLMILVGLLYFTFSGHLEMAETIQEPRAASWETSRLAQAFVTGGYGDAVSYRLGKLGFTMVTLLILAPSFLGLFLTGMLAGRTRFLTAVAEHRRILVKILVVCGAVGLVGNFLSAWILTEASVRSNYGLMTIGAGIVWIFGPVLTAAYLSGTVLAIHHRPNLAILPPIAAVGRMALTHYLAQSLIATTIFYGYGFGLGGNTGRLGTIGIALLIYAAQVMFSVLWLKHFRYGPMEWLWRSLTYKTCPPMRREG